MGPAGFLNVLDQIPSLLKKKPPDVLYHYTSQRGLLGIIEKKKLWATHIRYLNDSTEFDYPLESARKLLCKERDSSDERRAQFAEKALAQLNSSLDINTAFTVYVASFSRNRNQLSQWRGYCTHGSGFSVGFRVSNLRNLVERRSNDFDLAFVPCLYRKEDQNALISELISRAITVPTNTSAEVLFVLSILRWAPAIKHKKFEEEAEWRLVARGVRDDSSFRERHSFLIPYVEFDLTSKDRKGIDCIKSVTVGPTSYPKLSEQSVKDLLSKHGVDNCKTSCSGIPLR